VTPALASGEVHVWRSTLDVGEAERERLARTLSSEEGGRALRLHTVVARRRFVAARGILRRILGRYLAVAPSALRFAAGAYGKPVLPGSGLQFNVSHSEGIVMYAVSVYGPVGVDVERISPALDWAQIAAHALSPGEAAALHDLPAGDRRAAFFSCWTRKEAYLKARGYGLRAPLEAFDVSVGPAVPPALLALRAPLADGRSWWLRDCHPAPGYVAAVAGEGRLVRLHCLEWDA
jgi:4'-phosphopantetheinyl transferase